MCTYRRIVCIAQKSRPTSVCRPIHAYGYECIVRVFMHVRAYVWMHNIAYVGVYSMYVGLCIGLICMCGLVWYVCCMYICMYTCILYARGCLCMHKVSEHSCSRL